MLTALKTVSENLAAYQIPYMISGSVALNAYVTPRMTRDIDLVIALDQGNLDRFFEAFREGFYLDQDDIRAQLKRSGMFNLIETKSGVTIDFIIQQQSDYRRTEFERRRKDDSYGFEIWIASPEDLILSKLIWIQQLFSEKQLIDIQNLLEYSPIDIAYIRSWVSQLRLKTFSLPL